MEATEEARTLVVKEVSSRLQREFDERLMVEQKKHREEIEKLQVRIPRVTVTHTESVETNRAGHREIRGSALVIRYCSDLILLMWYIYITFTCRSLLKTLFLQSDLQ